ncbi:hypothetical protein ABEB36_003043 [Hypothenemus hampei]|uniref:Uncharacterized protein n=1 Tax=Hypothenemus hampei TaxID=57062 RepID=A0ABD1FBH3_HYPHA
MNVTTSKVCVAILFGLWRFFWGILPMKLNKLFRKWEETSQQSKTFVNERRHKQIIYFVALIQSFGGGVLFATCFLHMMKELYLSIEELKYKNGVSNEYPISQLIISFGFFFIYFLEEFTYWIVNSFKKRKCNEDHIRTIIRNGENVGLSSVKPSKISPIKTIITKQTEDGDTQNSEKILARTLSSKSTNSIKEDINQMLQEEQLTIEEEEIVKTREQLMRFILTIAALSLHAVLEGLSIGIQKMADEVWYLSISVSLHSASILFCLGVELVLAQTRLKYILIHVLAMTLASPFGILLGLIVAEETSAKPTTMSIATVVLEGFSAGAILYIIFFEVLNREKERRVYRLQRGFCILGGFLLMALLQYLQSLYTRDEIEETIKKLNNIHNFINKINITSQ